MSSEMMMMVVVFVGVVALAALIGMVVSGPKSKVDTRLDQLVGKESADAKPETVAQIARTALPKMGKVIVPEDEAERTKLRARLVHAGLYNPQAMHIFLGVKLTLLALATLVGGGLTLTGVLPVGKAMPVSMVLFLIGMVGPSFWLDGRKKKRQQALRRGLPDTLDVLIICLEGGMGLQAGLKRVSDELRAAHPVLGGELRIVDREVQLGRGPGEALLHFAQRTDLEEALSLSAVITQSERFGASLVKSLRSYSDTMRHQRRQKAEEKAQKAATKILIPTLLFIFPAVFVILLAPAVYRVMEVFSQNPPPK